MVAANHPGDGPDLDAATLSPLVRSAFGDETATITGWSVAPIGYAAFAPAQRRLFRVSGEARIGELARPWSIVLKVLHASDAAESARFHPYDNDPRRERLFYQSGVPDEMVGLAAPRLFASDTQSDGSVWLWLEDVVDETDRTWTEAQYALAARALGRYNGGFAGRIPPYPWLTEGRWGPRAATRPVFQAAGAMIEDDEVWEHAAVQTAFPAGTRQRVQRAWEEHDHFWEMGRRLPRTLCHHDAFRDNLFLRTGPDGDNEIVAIDWAMTGHGCIGADLAPLLCASVGHFAFPADRARELAETAYVAYLGGLRDAGWEGERDLVRLGFLASLAPWVTVSSGLRYFVSDDLAERVRQVYGKSLPELRDAWSALTLVLLDLVEEARDLLPTMANRGVGNTRGAP